MARGRSKAKRPRSGPGRSGGFWRSFFKFLLVLLVVAGAAGGALWWYLHPAFKTTPGVLYSTRREHDLTLNVYQPENANGIGVLVMVSGGWKSAPDKIPPWMLAPLLRNGQTVFAVSHLSQPDATIMEIVEDVNRAVRFVRHHADEYGVNRERLAVVGGSSGGHLGLMLATRGGPGQAMSNDPVDRESSAVQAAAVFYPVTDLLNLGSSTENLHDGGPPKSFRNAFGPQAKDLRVWKRIGHDTSPIFHVTSALPPIFIIHGDADTLVPLDQSERFKKRASEVGRTVELLVRPGKGHGWMTMLWDEYLFASWLNKELLPSANPISF